MKIYTKAGDRGTSTLLGGNIVPKDHPRLEAYGTLDELNSWIGLIRDQLDNGDIRKTLMRIQDRIMVGSTILASEKKDASVTIPQLHEKDITFLEREIDRMEQELKPLQSFILPGGHTTVSYCHLARTTCRRAERYSVKFIKNSAQTEILVKYLNRLSDYLFVLARKIAMDLKIEEIIWQPDF
ncbi:MAG: cob(I)yrinic acid a c-diamide adenosyltransferase [Bacteroides sp. SM1_62]|nr:MAG: cob(I)yrinic acid a c-diamide adenosyltransferase [Bacteroides sp. SM23_62]KPL25767.1 MAG: cob(I)yrinic acid a c-diamide adenosyltransferase [Bacteroides sp. SM1_62]